MAGELVPTRVTDKNGRLTTVHRRQEVPSKASKSLGSAAPTIPTEAPAERSTATPLIHPAPMEAVEVQDFVRKHHEALYKYPVDGGPTSGHVFVGFLDPVSKAYIRDAIERGYASMELIDYLIFKYRETTKPKSAYEPSIPNVEAVAQLRTSLLVADALGKDFPMLASSNVFDQGSLIGGVITGLSYNEKVSDRPAYTRVTTEEELASLIAVTALVMEGYRQSRSSSSIFQKLVFEVNTGERRNGVILANQSLSQFLRENPRETHRVIAYSQERDLGKTAEDAEQVIRYLRESKDIGPVSDGWL